MNTNKIYKFSEYILSLSPIERYTIYTIITGTFYIGPLILGGVIGFTEGSKVLASPLLESSLITSTNPSIPRTFFKYIATSAIIIIIPIYFLLTKGFSIGYGFGYAISVNEGTLLLASISPHSVFIVTAYFVSGITSLLIIHLLLVFYKPPKYTNKLEFKPRKEITYLIVLITVLLLLGSILETLLTPELVKLI